MSLDQETIAQQHELLTTYRRTLAHLLQQAAQHGGVTFAPPQVFHGISEAREQIQQIKATLRGHGIAVEDLPGEELPSQPAHPSTMPGTVRGAPEVVQNITVSGGAS